jgi:RNA-directed DNA polymerase
MPMRAANLDETEEAALRWEATGRQKVEAFVNKIQTRIAKAAAAGNKKPARFPQRMPTHSHYAKLWAIRKVTGTRGGRTAGIDNGKWDSPAKKCRAAGKLEKKGYGAKALKRAYITKSNGKKRPLGIPAMTVRAMRALEAAALDPITGSGSDTTSFGFRKSRSRQGAMEQLFIAPARKTAPEWVAGGDIKACFDEMAREWLTGHMPTDNHMLKQFLKAGYVYEKQLFPTENGTPQGGLISPMLANAALNGIETLLKGELRKATIKASGKPKTFNPKINPVRYADDFAITAAAEETAERVKEPIKNHMAQRGLQLSEEKTVTTNISRGFGFPGRNFRKYKGKPPIKPSKKSRQKVKEKLRQVIAGSKGATQDGLIGRLNPAVNGWSTYHQGTVARKAFSTADNDVYLHLWKWARHRRPGKSLRRVMKRCRKTVGNKHYVFMDTLTLKKMCDKKIIRHIPLKLDKNPYIDKEYFQKRRYRLLVNRTLGLNLENKQPPKTEAGNHPADGCLSEA